MLKAYLGGLLALALQTIVTPLMKLGSLEVCTGHPAVIDTLKT